MRIDQWTLAKSSINGKSVTQRTLVKCCRKMMPMIGQRTKFSRSRQWPNVAKKQLCPLSEDFVSLQTSTKCGPKSAPHWRTLFNQMWPKMCPLLEDFVTQRTLTKCGPKCAPPRGGLRPNVAQNVPHHWRTLSCSGL
jgi:hypothetical protein